MKIELELTEKTKHSLALLFADMIKPLLLSNGYKEDNTIFDVQELAQYLKVKKQWIYDKIHKNEIPYYKVGKYPRFRKSIIDEWLEQLGNENEKKTAKNKTKIVRRLLDDTT